ncbi:DUF5947 family protein [Streptosporangium sp. NPDC002524]|uniref:DUF5947 family protein n=1 Tax=Streptosporangium sp. NPDC002524 TaxID=3154537 RepID=UPI003325854B
MRATGLRRFREPPRAGRSGESRVTLCEVCAAPAGEDHGHVVNVERRRLLCACRACHLLFTGDTSDRARYRAVPRRYLHDPRFLLDAADWDEMRIPVRTAFFLRDSATDRTVAFYPSPAGATESPLPPETWERVLAANPAMAGVRPDVEALLVDRRPDGGFACHLVPIDACYELVGLIRLHWKGFDGGREAREAVEGFFAGLRERSRTVTPVRDGEDRGSQPPAPDGKSRDNQTAPPIRDGEDRDNQTAPPVRDGKNRDSQAVTPVPDGEDRDSRTVPPGPGGDDGG